MVGNFASFRQFSRENQREILIIKFSLKNRRSGRTSYQRTISDQFIVDDCKQRVGPSTPPYHPHAPPLQQFTNFHSFTQVSPLQRSVESRESEAGVSTSAPYSSPITGAASTASSEAVQPPLSFRFEDSFEDRTDRTDRTLPRSGHLSITPNPAVVAQLNKKIEEILTQNEENMRKARQETVDIWKQRLADKEEEWYLEQEVELKKKETQLKAEFAQEKAELRAAHAQHITSLEASHGQHIAKLETEKEMRDEKIDHLSGWVRYLTEEYNKTRTELDAKINEKTSEVAHMMEQVTNLTNELRSIRGNLRPPRDRRLGPPRMNPFEESETVPAPGNLIIRARSQAGEWTEQTRHHVTLAPTVGAQGSFSTALYPDSTVLYPAVDHSGDPGDPYMDQRPQQILKAKKKPLEEKKKNQIKESTTEKSIQDAPCRN